MTRRTISICAALLACSASALAFQETKPAPVTRVPTLHVGDPVPPLDVVKWIKGTEIADFERGRVYVVEFWTTWCQPCIAGMPHLTALQRQYADKGLRVISVSWGDTRGNTLEAAEK